MKNRNWLLYIAIIASTAIFIGVISYATDKPLKPAYTVQSVETDDTAMPSKVSKKTCGCCAQRYERQQARIEQARARQSSQE
ncbi:hypothetical protein J5I95_22575 [Candidatus Poribacteria bacterium]|nr:hypothetical protein [Candidatus Poribacteria bacterium]